MPPKLASDIEGTVIGEKYALVRLVGEGGMGKVFEAENTWTGRRVAIKTLLPEFLRRPDVVQRFMQEARAASRVAHKNIIDVLDLGRNDADGSFYIVYEFLTGIDVRTRLSRPPPLTVRDALDIMVPVMGALVAAHRSGVVHRDLKPENILLARAPDGELVPTIIDFGISKLTEPARGVRLQTLSGATLGTPPYMAPEQTRGADQADERADVWAVGVMLYELIAGRAPFEADNDIVLMMKLMGDDAQRIEERVPAIPRVLADAIHRALQRDPGQRFASMRAFLGAVLECPLGEVGPRVGPIADDGRVAAEYPAERMALSVDGDEPLRNDEFADADLARRAATLVIETARWDGDGGGDGGVANEPVDAMPTTELLAAGPITSDGAPRTRSRASSDDDPTDEQLAAPGAPESAEEITSPVVDAPATDFDDSPTHAFFRSTGPVPVARPFAEPIAMPVATAAPPRASGDARALKIRAAVIVGPIAVVVFALGVGLVMRVWRRSAGSRPPTAIAGRTSSPSSGTPQTRIVLAVPASAIAPLATSTPSAVAPIAATMSVRSSSPARRTAAPARTPRITTASPAWWDERDVRTPARGNAVPNAGNVRDPSAPVGGVMPSLLSRTDIARVISPLTPRLSTCAPAQSGMVTLALVIRGSGLVQRADATGPFERAQAACMEAILRSARFPQFRLSPQAVFYGFHLAHPPVW